MSDTPRTDAVEWDADLHNMAVDADFARSLERENARLRAELARVIAWIRRDRSLSIAFDAYRALDSEGT